MSIILWWKGNSKSINNCSLMKLHTEIQNIGAELYNSSRDIYQIIKLNLVFVIRQKYFFKLYRFYLYDNSHSKRTQDFLGAYAIRKTPSDFCVIALIHDAVLLVVLLCTQSWYKWLIQVLVSHCGSSKFCRSCALCQQNE